MSDTSEIAAHHTADPHDTIDQFTCPEGPAIQKAMHEDMLKHLKTPAGRLSNYHGKYPKSHIYAGMVDYPHVFRKDDYDRIMDEKRHKFAMGIVKVGEDVLDILTLFAIK